MASILDQMDGWEILLCVLALLGLIAFLAVVALHRDNRLGQRTTKFGFFVERHTRDETTEEDTLVGWPRRKE